MMSAAPAPRGGFNFIQFLLDVEKNTRRLRGKRRQITGSMLVAGAALAALQQLAKA